MGATTAILSLVLITLYLYFIYYYTKELRAAVVCANNKMFTVTYSICLLLPGLLLLYLLKGEKYIYFWDYATYWIKSIQYTQQFNDNPFQAIKNVFFSISTEEYNSLPNLLLGPANNLLGLNYNAYAFAVYIIYFLPFALVFSNILIKTSAGISNNLKLAIPFFILLFTPCLIPIRYGFVDAVGLVYIAIAVSILVNTQFLKQLSLNQSALLGIVLLLLIFSRRWYAFWFVAFYFSVFVVNIIYAIKNKDKKAAINTVINLGIAGIVPLALMLVFFYPFFEMSVLKDYQDIYSAYRRGSLLNQVKGFGMFFGWGILACSALGLALSVKKEKSFAGFFSISAIIIVVLFTRVNDFGGYQHFYLLVPFILFFFVKAAVYLNSRNRYAPLALFILLLFNNLFVFCINTPDSHNYLFANVDGKEKIRADYEEISRLANKVEKLEQAGNSVYCLSSGGVLNENILANTKLPNLSSAIFKMPAVQHVDKRDHFPNGLFLANYIITTIPVQLHLGAENQKLIAYFNSEVTTGSLKGHYEKVDEYLLDENVTAVLLKKVNPLTDAEIAAVYNYFKSAYPDYPAMYNVNNSILRSFNVINGDNFGSASFEDAKTINLSPGTSRPTEVSLMYDQAYTSLSFTATFNNKESINHDCNPERDGEVFFTVLENDRVLSRTYIIHKKDTTFTLDISNRKKITLRVDKGKNEDYCDWFKVTGLDAK